MSKPNDSISIRLGVTKFYNRVSEEYLCFDSAFTIIVNTMQVQRTKRPYPVLNPEKDSIFIPCPPLLNQKASQP